MSLEWTLIAALALVTAAIRVTGLIVGTRLNGSRWAWVLDDLPGLIVVGLVGASLADQGLAGWIAAGVALAMAKWTGNVIATMAAGMAAFALISF
ncbi:MAG: AzlD domain-containing protein [Pseudomonadota bacterium]